MEIPDEMLKEIRESGYDQELVYNYIRELLDSQKRKFPKENNNLELIDNYLSVSYTHLTLPTTPYV